MKRLFVSGVLFFALLSAAGEVLFENGKSNWQIGIAEKSTPAEKNAAGELQRTIKIMSGVELPIISGSDFKAQTIVIKVGEVPGATAKDDAFQVYTKDGKICCTGSNPRSALYAVYAFLEKVCGVRWVWPGASGEFIPKRTTLTIPELKISEKARFAYRGFHVCGSFYNEEMEQFMSRNRMNIMRSNPVNGKKWIADWNDKRIARGFHMMFSNHNIAIYDKTVFARKPELFALVNGKRVPDQLCWSNPEVDKIMIDRFIKYIQEYPAVEIISLFPADNMNYCRCEKCSAKKRTDLWFDMFNRLSAGIKAAAPRIKTASLAYQSYLEVPETRLDDTAFIEYCMYNRCYVHKLGSCQLNTNMLKSLDLWRKKGVPLVVYGYEFDIFTPAMFMPFTSMLQDQMKNFAKLGLQGAITEVTPPGYRNPQAVHSPSGLNPGVHHRMGHYVYARLLWNPDTPMHFILKDFTEAAFGDAAAEMKAYYELMDKAWNGMKIHYSYFFNSPLAGAPVLLHWSVIAKCDKFFADAAVKAGKITDPARKKQVLENLAVEKKLFEAWKRNRQDYLSSQSSSKILLPETGDPGDAVELPGFVDSARKTPKAKTVVKMRYDEQALYIDALCFDPDITKLIPGSPAHDDELWNGEALDIFIAVPGDTQGVYRHLMVNASGGKYEAVALGGMTFNKAWNPQWEVKSTIGKDHWQVEIRLPFAAFGKKGVEKNEAWGFAIKRSNGAVRKELPNSGFPDAVFHDPNAFGVIQFSGLKKVYRTMFFSKHKEKDVNEMKMLMENYGFQPRTSRNEKELNTTFPEQDIYIIRHYRGIKLDPEFFRKNVLPKVEKGALLLFASWGELPLDRYFGKADFAVNWSGWKVDPRRKSLNVKEGKWQNAPHDLRHILKNSLTPSNGYLPAVEGKWENYGSLKMADGKVFSFLLVRRYGKGLIVLTSADFGMSGGGAMFGSRKEQSAKLLGNLQFLNECL